MTRCKRMLTKRWRLRITMASTFHMGLPYSNTAQSQLEVNFELVAFPDFTQSSQSGFSDINTSSDMKFSFGRNTHCSTLSMFCLLTQIGKVRLPIRLIILVLLVSRRKACPERNGPGKGQLCQRFLPQ